MKNIFMLLKLETIRKSICKAFARFPLSVFLAVITTIFLLILLHVNNLSSVMSEIFEKSILTFVVMFFLSVGMQLFCETQKKVIWNIGFSTFFPLVFGALFYFFFKNDFSDTLSFTYVVVTLLGIIFLLFFAPYIGKLRKQNFSENSYYTYFYSISTVFLLSVIFNGILALLGSIGIHSIYTLFDISFFEQGKVLATWIILTSSLITPIFALSELPSKEYFFEEYFNENMFFSFLIRYVAIPFIFIYFVILYAYSLKVLLDFKNWPRGEVSWMVIGFSIFGYASYIFSYIFEGKNKSIEFFRKYFPYVVLPQLAMLFYAIYLRIAQYDITMNRYLVVVFGIWLLIISLYFVFSRKKSLIIIPSLITLFTLVISIGPWSVYSLPYERQTQRLKDKLVEANICETQACSIITPLKNYEDIEADLSKDIYSGINYICGFENCERIKKLFPEIYTNLEKKSREDYEKWQKNDRELQENEYTGLRKWEIVSEITEILKVRNYIPDEIREDGKYFSFYTRNLISPIDVSGYKNMYELNLYQYSQYENEFEYESETKVLTVGDQEVDMKPILLQIISEAKSGEIFTYIGKDFKMIILNASLKKEGDTILLQNIHGYILWK